MFPINVSLFASSGNIVAQKKFASQEATMFTIKFIKSFAAEKMFSSLPTSFHTRNIVFPIRHVKAMFFRLGM